MTLSIRKAVLEQYLTDISTRSLSNLIEDYPHSDAGTHQSWINLFLLWKIKIRLSLLRYLSDAQAWRRIEYLFEEILFFLECDQPVSADSRYTATLQSFD